MNLCGIVLYNPDINRLEENINAIVNQVDAILLIDNGSKNINVIFEKYNENNKIYFEFNPKNEGIAKALNQILDYAKNNSYSWVMTLDQDSVCPSNIISEFEKYRDIENIGIICPYTIDRNATESIKKNLYNEYVERCITSASFINVNACYKIARFDEKMFIDLVDYDYSYQVTQASLKILRIANVELLHQLGNLKNENILGRTVEVTNHNDIRKYYYSKNCVYLCKKYKKIKIMKLCIPKLWNLTVKTLLFEKNKKYKFKAICKGIIDGLTMQMY